MERGRNGFTFDPRALGPTSKFKRGTVPLVTRESRLQRHELRLQGRALSGQNQLQHRRMQPTKSGYALVLGGVRGRAGDVLWSATAESAAATISARLVSHPAEGGGRWRPLLCRSNLFGCLQ